MISSHLNTADLQLRPFSPDDAGDVLAYWQSDPGWEIFNASVPSNFAMSDATVFVAEICARSRGTQPSWAIVFQGSVVGIVSLTLEQSNSIAVIGYGVHGDLRGRGIAAAAASLIITEAFSCYPQLRKVRAHTDGENLPSMRVLEKLGFSREELLRNSQIVKGRLVDEAIYGVRREEWGK